MNKDFLDNHGLLGVFGVARCFLLAFIFMTTACTSSETATLEAQIINVYTTSATQPWLADVFACAPPGTVIRVADSPADADVSLQSR